MPPTTADPNLGGRQPSWDTEDLIFEFQRQQVTKAPRAWDREAKTGSSTHHKGRKVWKRYGLRRKDVNKPAGGSHDDAPAVENSPRVVKRRCLVQPPLAQPPLFPSKLSQYLPTLRDRTLTTPRRKISKRKSLRASILAPSEEVAEDPGLVQVYSDGENTTRDQLGHESETIRETLWKDTVSECTDLRTSVAEGEPDQAPAMFDTTKSGQLLDVTASSGKPMSSHLNSLPKLRRSEQYSPRAPTADGVEEELLANRDIPLDIESHAMPQEEPTPVPAPQANISNVDGCNTPSARETTMEFSNTQSGSKRRRSRRRSTLKGCKTSPWTQDSTLSLPDQPENLAADVQNTPFTAENQDDVTDGSRTKDLVSDDDIMTEQMPQVQSEDPKAAQQEQEKHVQEPEVPSEETPKEGSTVSMPANASEDQVSEIERVHVPSDMQDNSVANRTRSGARFSDDTSMLKDFLNRAQARKAAKSTEVIPAPESADTLRRSPRKILGQLDKNSPSPIKTRDLAHRPGTPPGKTLTGLLGYDDADELCNEPVVHRRSARKCPSAKKETPGAPSFIPVRRPDGADPVVLQKSVAQELAIVTRANTRRNKGTSKLPKIMLETLASKLVEDMPVMKKETRSTKCMDWDEELVYFRENSCSREGREEKAEARPKVRRLKGRGSLNGTPAPKTVGSKISSNGTPAPKRRGKTK